MGAENKKELDSERLGKVETEVHLLTSGFAELKELIGKLFLKLEDHQKETAPKPISYGMILSGGVAIITMLGAMFAIMIYISSSTIAPIMAQNSQMINTMNTLLSQQTKLSSDIQLANKDISVIKGKSLANEQTLQWIIFEENLPKQITQIKKDIEYIKRGK